MSETWPGLIGALAILWTAVCLRVRYGLSAVGLGAKRAPGIAGEQAMGRLGPRFLRVFRGGLLAASTGTWVSVFDPLSWRDALATRAAFWMRIEL